MSDPFAMARHRARFELRAPPRPAYSPDARIQMLMRARTMAEIRQAADRLGFTFNEAYRERGRLFEERWHTDRVVSGAWASRRRPVPAEVQPPG